MPGAVPITSTYALTNATLPYVLALAEHGVAEAIAARPRPDARGQRRRGQGHPPGGRRGRRDGLHPARRGARDRGRRAVVGRRRWRGERGARGLSERPRRGRGGEMATATQTKLKNFIDGEFVDPAEGATEEVINPSTGEPIAEAPLSSKEDVDRAVAAARRAFGTWSLTTPSERAAMLLEARRRDRGARRGALRPRVGRRRQAAAHVPRRRDPGLRRTTCASSPARRGAWRARRPGEYIEGYTSMIRREPVGVVRADHALELPADDGDLEDRARARRRQHDRAQAGREHPADRRSSSPRSRPRSSRRASST